MDITATPYQRNRLWLAVAIILVIGIGLASRRFPSYFPSTFGSQTGDALWALMVFLGIAFWFPKMERSKLTLAALAVAYLVEAGQLYKAPWINQIRATTVGHLVLGTGFQWLDLVAYAFGIAAGFLGDIVITRARTNSRQ